MVDISSDHPAERRGIERLDIGEDRFRALKSYLSARPGMIQDGDRHYVHPRDLLLNADVLNLAVEMAPAEAECLSNITCYWEFGGTPKSNGHVVELMNNGRVYGALEFFYSQEPMDAKFNAWPEGVRKTERAEKIIGHMISQQSPGGANENSGSQT